jgi:hypothetical protein
LNVVPCKIEKKNSKPGQLGRNKKQENKNSEIRSRAEKAQDLKRHKTGHNLRWGVKSNHHYTMSVTGDGAVLVHPM